MSRILKKSRENKSKLAKPDKEPTLSLHWWANQFAMDDESLRRSIVKSGSPSPEHSARIEGIVVKKALLGDKVAAEIRLKEAQAADQERKNKIADGEMIPLTENLAWQDRVLMPIRQRLLALAGSLAHLCNPTDPQHAEEQLTRWVNETLPMLRAEIGKVNK
jgi:hypothetical protein